MSASHDQLPEKPRPEYSDENQPYWNGLREHRLLVQHCGGCNTLRHYPRPLCDRCYSLEYDWTELSGSGKVHSWTVSHHPFHPGFKRETPYVTVTVDLTEGVRLQGPLEGNDASGLAIGREVELTFNDVDAELTLPGFRLV